MISAPSALDAQALTRLAPAIQDELRHYLLLFIQEGGKKALRNSSALKHVFARLYGSERSPEDWRRFVVIAAPIMRRLVITYVSSGKLLQSAKLNFLHLERWLTRLETFDLLCVSMIDLHYFSGLSIKETAAVLDLTPETVVWDLRSAKAWLRAYMAWHAGNTGERSN